MIRHWQDRAEEAWSIATEMTDAHTKAIMVGRHRAKLLKDCQVGRGNAETLNVNWVRLLLRLAAARARAFPIAQPLLRAVSLVPRF
jgi:hypothetical protein